MQAILFALAAGSVIVMYFMIRHDEVRRNRKTWDDWQISSYRITLRYDKRSMSFDAEILGDITTLTVVNDKITNVIGAHVENSTIEEYLRFTIDGLFEQVAYYTSVRYDSVYGFPTRLGIRENWVIEVISFEILN